MLAEALIGHDGQVVLVSVGVYLAIRLVLAIIHRIDPH